MSLYFAGNTTSYLTIPNHPDLLLGTDDFTIEWYQYETDSHPFPRIFQMGNYNAGINIGVSIEGGTFIFWTPGNISEVIEGVTILTNVWIHFAIAREAGTTRIFMDGVQISVDLTEVYDFTTEYDLTIGNETGALSDVAAFGGYLTGFAWTKGVSIYNANFSPPTSNPAITDNTVLMLNGSGGFGTLGNTIINVGVMNGLQVPPEYGETPTVEPTVTTPNLKKASLFSDQSSFSRIDRLRKNAMNTVKNTYEGGYYHKNSTEKNSVTSALSRTRGGGYTVPPKVTNRK